MKTRLKRIEGVLRSHGLNILNRDEVIQEIRDEKIRFFHVLASDAQGHVFFVKMLADINNGEAATAMKREALLHRSLSELARQRRISGLRVKNFWGGQASSNDDEIYIVVDAFPRDAQLGFVHKEEDMLLLSSAHAKKIIQEFFRMQRLIKTDFILKEFIRYLKLEDPDNIFNILPVFHADYQEYQEDVLRVLSVPGPNSNENFFHNYVSPADQAFLLAGAPEEYEQYLNLANDVFGIMPLWMVMELRLEVKDFRACIHDLLGRCQRTIASFQEEKKLYLVHGDACPRNTFFYNSCDVEFFDWGHAGLSRNKLLALVYDYGNMRARAWNNLAFREALDDEILNHFRRQGKEEAGKVVVALGILRSHCLLAGFFEKYDTGKQRKEQEKRRKLSTELDVRKAFDVMNVAL